MYLSPEEARIRTIQVSVTVEGIGIHTGAHTRVTLHPHDGFRNGTVYPASRATGPDSVHDGIVFQPRPGVFLPATAANVVDTSRCTVLGTEGVTVSTVEHLLSALAGVGITHLTVEVDGPELPIGDGSARIWNDAIASAGVRDWHVGKMEHPKLPCIVAGRNGSFIAAYPAPAFRATVAAVFDHPLVGTQVARYDEAYDNYLTDVSPARTFGFIEEVEALRKAGLALGGSEENAVVVYPDHYSKPLRFPNELARHKLLDLMGDLALAGLPLPNMEVFAAKPSHRLNVEFAKALCPAPDN